MAPEQFNFAPWKPPFRYDDEGSCIVDSENQWLLDIRGWAFLTGKGHAALGIDEEKAVDIQDALGRNIADLLNGQSVSDGQSLLSPPITPETASLRLAEAEKADREIAQVLRDLILDALHINPLITVAEGIDGFCLAAIQKSKAPLLAALAEAEREIQRLKERERH